ncbi:MAG: hypothetical protein H0U70_09275 [Tatlockia sp.]|nr:hypothetical protein [Tatlockia sp.]
MLKKYEIIHEKYKDLHSIEKSPLLIEYEHTPESINQNIAFYRIHISFISEKNAKEFFSVMENHLPLSLRSNRVIIGTDKDYGVLPVSPNWRGSTFQAPFINFKDPDTAEQFYFFIQGRVSWKLNTSITCFEKREGEDNQFVYFRSLLEPDCSIEHRSRIYKEAVTHCVFVILILKEVGSHFPSDLALLIGINLLNSLSRPNDHLRQAINRTKRFKLPDEPFEQPYQRINCTIKYSLFEDNFICNEPLYKTRPLYNINLICSNDQEAILLKKNMDKALTEFSVVVEGHEARVQPIFLRRVDDASSGVSTVVFSKQNGISLSFLDSLEAATFISFVNILSCKVETFGDQIFFPELISRKTNEEKRSVKNLGNNSLFSGASGRPRETDIRNEAPKEKNTNSWEMSGCEMLGWFCLPVIGWAYLLAYAVYCSCYSEEIESTNQSGLSV